MGAGSNLIVNFRIRRGVLQGDVTSPIYFILALEYVLRLHDTCTDGVSLLEVIVHTLGYADDLALTNKGGEEMSEVISTRISNMHIKRLPRRCRHEYLTSEQT